MERLCVLLGILVILLAGCGEENPGAAAENEAEEQILYENERQGLQIVQADGWSKKEEISDPFNVSFENGKSTVIISKISNEKSLGEIKDELVAGSGKVKIVDEGEDFVSFETDRNDSVRSDVSIERDKSGTRLIIFITPVEEYENNKGKFDAFREKINFK